MRLSWATILKITHLQTVTIPAREKIALSDYITLGIGQKSFKNFSENYFPELQIEVKKDRSNKVNGVAASYYGVSNVGAALHNTQNMRKRRRFPRFPSEACFKGI